MALPPGFVLEEPRVNLPQGFVLEIAPPPKPSKERTFGEAAKDIAAGVVSGAGSLVQLPGQLYGLATGDFSETGALGLGKDIQKYGEEMKSAGLKDREAERAEKIRTAEQKGQWEAFKTAFGETIKDPALLTSFLAEQAPQLLVPFGAAKVAQIGTAAKAAAAAQGLTGTAAKEAVEAVTKEAARRGTAAAVGAGAVQQGADVGAQSYEDIYKELISKGAAEKDAAQGAINLARAAGASGALISLLAQRLPGAKTLEESFAGVRGPGGRLLGAARGALGEGASEIVEETGGKFGANLALREVAPETELTSGLGATAGMAAIGGVGMGGAAGLAQRPSPKIEIINGKKFVDGKPVEPEAPAAPAAETPVTPEAPTAAPIAEAPSATPDTTAAPEGTVTPESPAAPEVPAVPEVPAAPPVAPAPVSEAPPVVEPPAPPVTPTVETTAPAAEMPAPPVEAAAPVVEAAAPSVPVAEAPSRSSEAWRTEGKTPQELMADKVESVGVELAMQIAEEASAKDFTPTELPAAIQQWANDSKVPADDLRASVIKALDKFDISEARKTQVKKALSPLRAAPKAEAPAVEAPATRKEAQAFGKAIGAAQPYPGELRGRVNLPAQKAAKEGNFQGVLSALEKSKNVIVAEIAKRARALGTKIVIDDNAEETYTGPSTLMRQMSIDGAKMHLEALNKIRELAPQVDALPDGSPLNWLGFTIRNEKIKAIDNGKDAGSMRLEDIAKMGHSMFAPLSTGPIDIQTKEDFKRLQKAYEDLTSEYGENALQLTSTGSAEMRGVAGAYDADTDTIRVPEYTAKREDVLSHEIVHAQTVQAIASPTLRQKPIVARLNKLYEHVKKELESRPGRAPYGIQSIQEFVAEGMGNPAFQFLLKKIKYENTSAWDSFVQTIANLIGVKRDTAFTELLSIYSELTTEQKAETKVEQSAPAAATPAAPSPFMQRLQEYWGGTVNPAIKNYLSAFNSFGAERLESNQIKPAGMSPREWLESFVSKQSTWDKGRKTGVTGIQALSTKNLWPTADGSGERLRKSMLEAVKALRNAPGSTSELMDQAFTEERKSLGKAEEPAVEPNKTADKFLYSVEPTVKSDRLPSYKRGVENLRKRWDKGDLTSDEFASRVDILAKQIEMAELAKTKAGRERGADFLRQRLLEAKRRGELSPEAVDFAEWFILQNPALVDDLGISIRTPKEDGVGGMYDSYSRVMYLMKESGSDTTTVHEILHHLERMMPKEVQSAIRKTWIKSLMEAQRTAKTDAEKQFFKNLTDFHFGFGSRSLLKDAINAIKKGDVSKDLYRYTSPSEFWAENASEIMKGRFDVKGSILGRLKQWLSELKEKARSLFGLENKAAIIRALDSLSKGDGKFVTSTLLDETTEPKFSITPAVTPGQQALETIRNMGMDVPKPDPTKLEKAKDIWQKAKEDPKLTAQSAMKAARDFMDKVETWAFSPDAKLNNDFRRAVIKDFKENEGVLGQLLEMSQSQAVHADALSSQFLIDGGLKYNDDLKKWESFQSKANFPALSKKLDEIGAKYGLTKEQIERVAHTYLVAKRLPGLIERNKNLDAEIAAEQASIKPDKTKIKNLEDKKVFISDKQLEQIEPGLSLVKNIPELNQVVDMWNEIRKNTIDVMVNSGLWSPEYAQAMWDNMDYVPYFREDQIENEAGPQEFIRGLQVKSKEFQLKGSEDAVHDVFDNMIRWTQYAINRSVRAHKALQMVDNVKDIQIGDRKMAVKVTEEKRGMNIARVFRDGKQELYDMADPMYVQAFSAIQNVSIPTLKFMARVSNVLRQSVVLYPLFSVAQVPQDAFAAMFTSGLKTQHALKIPILAVKEFIKTLNKTSQTHETLKRFGATGVRDFSATVIRDDAEIYAGLKPPRGGWGKTKEFLSHISMAADNAVRQAVYEASMQQGVKQSEAIEKAFDLINFRRKGTSKMLNILGQTVPFFYAYLSAQRVALKVLTGTGISPTDRKEAFQTLATTSAAVATLSLLYAMANADDEDYMETPAAIRDRTLTIPGSDGVRIPLRPDFFLFPKIIAEHTYLLLSDQGYQDAAKFRTSMKDALISAVASPTPFPTAIKPAIEVAINYDFFQGKPLIGTFEKDKALERQFRDSTSEFAKLLGSTGLVSPIAADHMIRGMFGSFGGLFLYGTNQFLHSDPDVPRPELNATEMLAALPGTSGLLKRPQESALKNDFYTLRDEVEKAVNTFNDIKLRSPQGMEDFLADEKNMVRLSLGKSVDKINRELSKIRKTITVITNMPESQMSAEDKADYKRQLMEMERELLRSVDVKALREMAKI